MLSHKPLNQTFFIYLTWLFKLKYYEIPVKNARSCTVSAKASCCCCYLHLEISTICRKQPETNSVVNLKKKILYEQVIGLYLFFVCFIILFCFFKKQQYTLFYRHHL